HRAAVAVPIDIALPGRTTVDALALAVSKPLTGEGARIVDEKLGGRLSQLVESGELRGERGEALLLHTDGALEAPRVVAAGVGPRDALDADALRTAAAAAAHALERVGGTVGWRLDESLPPSRGRSSGRTRRVCGRRRTARRCRSRSSGSRSATRRRPSCGLRRSVRPCSPSARTARATSRTRRRTSSTPTRSASARWSSPPSTSI